MLVCKKNEKKKIHTCSPNDARRVVWARLASFEPVLVVATLLVPPREN
jgi:hypothetical protein